MKQATPYGSWPSPVTTELLTQGAVGLGQIAVDDGDVYWTELRPWENGRTVLVRRTPDGRCEDVTPPPFNVRSRVHEYGGGAFAAADGVVWFVDGADHRLYRVAPGAAPTAVTRPGLQAFADLQVDVRRDRLICVCEDHAAVGEPENTLVAIGREGDVTTLVAGADFYAFPRLSPDGRRLAWIEWNHPNMPWDGAMLKTALVESDGAATDPVDYAGGDAVAVFQPHWSPTGDLWFVDDRTGWWNLYRAGDREPRHAADAEFGLPLWQFGMTTYAFVDETHVVAAHAVEGEWRLGLLDAESGDMQLLETGWVSFGSITGGSGKVWFVGGRADAPEEVVEFEPETGRQTVLRRATDTALPDGSISVAETIRFPTTGGRVAYAHFYPPANAGAAPAAGEKPPLIVKSHGGPTGQSGAALSLKIQYWTSRGFAVVDVNYGGGSGYGRAYRERLNGQWGIVDVDDCVSAAEYLAGLGRVDRERMAISGGSAGGYTTLCALTFRDVFRAGCSSYGIGDLAALARDTHKFESRYLDRLVGEWPADADTYRARSPVHHTERLSCPVIFLQGAEDKVVPPNQAEAMVEALRRKGLPVAYILFEGEGHGFRKAENLRRALEAELSFYARVFGFDPADDIEPVTVENLDRADGDGRRS